MPSAANVKVDKQVTSETIADSTSTPQNSPLKQALTVIEHKIRNLEKRKVKLESYRDLQNSGKDLNQDQRIAIAKYDEVVRTLDFARDLCKQFQSIATVAEKEAKKQVRKEAALKNHQELAKLREVLLVQDALQQLGQDAIREDFLIGRNGAATLLETDLKLLDDLYNGVSPKHEPGSLTKFTSQVQSAAEHLLAVVEGKPKEIFGSTYTHIKEIIGKIHESGYLDQPTMESSAVEFIEEAPGVVSKLELKVEVLPELPMEALAMPMYHVEQCPLEEVPLRPPPVIEPQYFQQPRPITEMLGTGTFFFLQDSELDLPEQVPQNPVLNSATIPSQTFTNQNFVSMPEAVVPRQNQIVTFRAPSPNLPPPIPTSSLYLTALDYTPVGPIQTIPVNYPDYQQSPVQEEPVLPQQPPPPDVHESVRNGTNENGLDDIKGGSEMNLSCGGLRPSRNNHKHNGPPANHTGQSNYPQTYYQNNSTYGTSGRGRPSRGGARPGPGKPTQQQNAQNKHKPVPHL